MSPILSIALAYAALALACVQHPWQTISFIWGIVAVSAAGAVLIAPQFSAAVAFTVCWVVVLGSAGTVIVLQRPPQVILLALAAVTGTAIGLVAASSGSPLALVAAAPVTSLLLLATAQRWHGLKLLVRVVAAWMAAVALLSLAIPLVTTPGYRSDHRE